MRLRVANITQFQYRCYALAPVRGEHACHLYIEVIACLRQIGISHELISVHSDEARLGNEFRCQHFLLLELLERPVCDGFTKRYVPPERPVEFIELREPVGVVFEFRVGCYLQLRSSNLLFKPSVRREIEFRDIQAIIEAPQGLDKTPLCDEANGTWVCCPDLRVQFAWSERPQVIQEFLVEARTHALTLHVGVNPDVYLEF